MKKKIVDEATTGILLAMVAINVFVVFLPQWIATALGLLILCKLLYEYLPAITGTVEFSSEIGKALNFTAEHTENAKASESPNNC